MAKYAHEDAIAHLKRAIEVLDLAAAPEPLQRAEVLTELGAALKRGGEMTAARKSFGDAAEIALAHNWAALIAGAALGIESIPREAGVVDDYLVYLTEVALANLKRSHQPLRARLLACQASALAWHDDVGRRISLTREAIDIARRTSRSSSCVAAIASRGRSNKRTIVFVMVFSNLFE